MTETLTPPTGAEAESPTDIADALAEALSAIERVDYNALGEEDLRAVLNAKGTLRALCLAHRQMDGARDGRRADL